MYLLIDECCGKGLVSVAESLGHTAQRTREIGALGPGAPDRDIFAFARASGAVFVTINRADFADLARYGPEPHPGVIVLPSALGQELARLFRAVLPVAERAVTATAGLFVEIDRRGRITTYRLG